MRWSGLSAIVGVAIGLTSLQPLAAQTPPAAPYALPLAEPWTDPLPEPVSTPPTMSLADWESLALANNPTLVQAGARVQAARGQWVQAGLYPNPQVGYVGNEVGVDGRAGMHGPYWNQTIVTAGKLQLARNAAAAGISDAQRRWLAQELRVLTDVRQAFYEALVAQQTVAITRQLVDIGNEGVRAADNLLKAFEVSRVDVLQARIEADSARLLFVNAENRYAAAQRQLAALAGVPQHPAAPLVGDVEHDLPQLDWDSALADILNQSPELAAAQARLNQAQWTLERQIAEPYPNVDLQNSVQYDEASQYVLGNVQIGIDLPIFNRNQGAIRAARADLVTARADIQRLQLDLTRRLADAFERYSNARRQVEQYRESILPNARTSLELVGEGYRQGEFNYIALLTAQRTYFHANLAYLQSLMELRTSTAEIEGLLLSNSLSP